MVISMDKREKVVQKGLSGMGCKKNKNLRRGDGSVSLLAGCVPDLCLYRFTVDLTKQEFVINKMEVKGTESRDTSRNIKKKQILNEII